MRSSIQGGHIHVSVASEEDGILCSVADNGPGIADAFKPCVFDEFRQDLATREVSGALGLGLSICLGLVELHGGAITVDDAEPHGAVFSFTIPGPR
ncbi:ATP-binding protein [Magnetospirillum sp. 15-1]|uniref:sensor histidine kinase n=1 Tax=Magnetospirillum sp. 15-1 TaxID=1979370 RepID=UPI001F5B0A19|nr:ATP-binding protein [Magnetospirillum sp. 15-1]